MIAFVSHPARFKIDDCMGERIGVQLSEFRHLNGDKDVTPLRSGFSHGEGMDSSERSPIRQAVDGDLNTKWYFSNGASGKDMSKCWLQIDYAEPQSVTAYDWATANDRWLVEKPRAGHGEKDGQMYILCGIDRVSNLIAIVPSASFAAKHAARMCYNSRSLHTKGRIWLTKAR